MGKVFRLTVRRYIINLRVGSMNPLWQESLIQSCLHKLTGTYTRWNDFLLSFELDYFMLTKKQPYKMLSVRTWHASFLGLDKRNKSLMILEIFFWHFFSWERLALSQIPRPAHTKPMNRAWCENRAPNSILTALACSTRFLPLNNTAQVFCML